MELPNIVYRLENGRLWSVRKGGWLLGDAALAMEGGEAAASPEPAEAGEAPRIIELISSSGEADEGYLVRTLDFYHFPLGVLSLCSAQGVKEALADLDAEYLTPRVLGGLATGDEYALARWREHEERAQAYRQRLAELTGQDSQDN